MYELKINSDERTCVLDDITEAFTEENENGKMFYFILESRNMESKITLVRDYIIDDIKNKTFLIEIYKDDIEKSYDNVHLLQVFSCYDDCVLNKQIWIFTNFNVSNEEVLKDSFELGERFRRNKADEWLCKDNPRHLKYVKLLDYEPLFT